MSKIIPNKKVKVYFNDDDCVVVKGLGKTDTILKKGEYIHTNNNYLFWFGEGNIDEWCVYCVKPNKRTWFAYDHEYLSWIKKMGRFHGDDKVYDSFNLIFDNVCYDYDMIDGYNVISDVAGDYNRTEHFWTWFWMTMVAEERKENAILGKRIKKLGVYNVLFDKYKISYITRYMVGMKYYDLEKLMIERGI